MRIVFAGTPAVAVPVLRRLTVNHEVLAVVTRPDAPVGRKRVLTPSPVAHAATELGLPIIRAARLDEAATDQITALAPELGVIVAYGALVREPLLSAPTHGWINLHFSLLPAWRGAAPVQRALIAGEREFGASVFRLVPALDAGDVFAMQRVPVPDDATADVALALLAEAGAPLTADVVASIESVTAVPMPQEGSPTTAAKLTLADGALDWTRTATELYARFRGVTPEPGAHTSIADGRMKILAMSPSEEDEQSLSPGSMKGHPAGVLIGTASAPLLVTRVQPAGRASMDAADWWRGLRADTPPVAGS